MAKAKTVKKEKPPVDDTVVVEKIEAPVSAPKPPDMDHEDWDKAQRHG